MASIDYFEIVKSNTKLIDFTEDEISKLLTYTELRYFKKGDLIIKEGETDRVFFIIVKGEVGISKEISDQVVLFITTLKAKDIFGEMSVISKYPRSANAFAKTDVTLISMNGDEFNRLKQEQPMIFGKLSWAFANILSERMYSVEERLKKILGASLTSTTI
jgi:CRP-like cAMP-binding protein